MLENSIIISQDDIKRKVPKSRKTERQDKAF